MDTGLAVHIDIVERGLRAAMKTTRGELARRLVHTDALMAEHRAAKRHVEAAACAIRAQALGEAIAVLNGNALPALHAIMKDGCYSAQIPTPAPDRTERTR